MVNITDYAEIDIPEVSNTVDRVSLIFQRQLDLMHKYHPIYVANGFEEKVSKDMVVDMNSARGQDIFKYNIYCVHEEIGEALEAYNKGHITHYIEELIDALHFLTEACIVAGFQPMSHYEDYPMGACRLTMMFTAIENEMALGRNKRENITLELYMYLGTCCNTLKQKPWKQSHVLTDMAKFSIKLDCVWRALMTLFIIEGLSYDDVVKFYYQKAAVNTFRQKSNY